MTPSGTTHSTSLFSGGLRWPRLLLALGWAVFGCSDTPQAQPTIVCSAEATDGCRSACDQGHAASCEVLAVSQIGDATETPAAATMELLKRACDGDRPVACRHLATFSKLSSTPPGAGQNDPATKGSTPAQTASAAEAGAAAQKLFSKACRLGDAPACGASGAALLQAGQSDKGLQALRIACDGQHAPACRNLGAASATGNGVVRDHVRAAAYFLRGCDGGDREACVWLAELFTAGQGVNQDIPRAHRLLAGACDAGSAEACRRRAVASSKPVGKAPADAKAALHWLRRACALGSKPSCHEVGLAIMAGPGGITADPPAAFQALLKNCGGGYAASCTHVGLAHERGKGTAADPRQALAFFTRACDMGHPFGCERLGSVYAKGSGVPKDIVKAVSFFERACGGNVATACSDLGVLLHRGQGIPKNTTRAMALFKRACDLKDPGGCANQGFLLTTTGRPQDIAAGRALLDKACKQKNGFACQTLQRMQTKRPAAPAPAAGAPPSPGGASGAQALPPRPDRPAAPAPKGPRRPPPSK